MQESPYTTMFLSNKESICQCRQEQREREARGKGFSVEGYNNACIQAARLEKWKKSIEYDSNNSITVCVVTMRLFLDSVQLLTKVVNEVLQDDHFCH